MSLHSQLLRGLLALPVMLLLAIAGVIAPDATPRVASSLPAPDPAAAAARGEVPAMVDATLRAPCPQRVVRVQLAGR